MADIILKGLVGGNPSGLSCRTWHITSCHIGLARRECAPQLEEYRLRLATLYPDRY